jgi:hypothetical protein
VAVLSDMYRLPGDTVRQTLTELASHGVGDGAGTFHLDGDLHGTPPVALATRLWTQANAHPRIGKRLSGVAATGPRSATFEVGKEPTSVSVALDDLGLTQGVGVYAWTRAGRRLALFRPGATPDGWNDDAIVTALDAVALLVGA